MANLAGFWSYVHKDDQAEGLRISQLAHDIVDQYGLLNGEDIELFLDRDALGWGRAWREAIDEKLESVAFFVPILTPRFFKSAECRRELQTFVNAATNLGTRQLLLPILYVRVEDLHGDAPADALVRLVKEFQWEDWSETGLCSRRSSLYRRRVRALAQRLVDANRSVEKAELSRPADAVAIAGSVDESQESDVLGLLAKGEEAMPRWNQTMEQITDQFHFIAEKTQAGTDEMNRMDAQGKGFVGRLAVAKRLRAQLEAPCTLVLELAGMFAAQLHDIDMYIRIVIDRAPDELANNNAYKDQICKFFDSVRSLSAHIKRTVAELEPFAQATLSVQKISRDLRAPLRDLHQGLAVISQAQGVADEWVRLIEETSVDCPTIEPSGEA